MRLPGYRRREPDPISRGVMAPPPAKKRSALPRLRLHPLCLFGRHRPEYFRLSAPGEKWATFIYTCLRCNRVVGDSHAARSDKPRLFKKD